MITKATAASAGGTGLLLAFLAMIRSWPGMELTPETWIFISGYAAWLIGDRVKAASNNGSGS